MTTKAMTDRQTDRQDGQTGQTEGTDREGADRQTVCRPETRTKLTKFNAHEKRIGKRNPRRGQLAVHHPPTPPLIAVKNRIERIDIYAKMGKCDAACQMR